MQLHSGAASTMANTLIQLYIVFKSAILDHSKMCSHIVEIFDETNVDIQTQTNFNYKVTYLLLSETFGNGTSDLRLSPFKFSSPCALIVRDVSDLLPSFTDFPEEETTPWPPPGYLGSPTREFSVLVLKSCNESVVSSYLVPVARKLYNSFFAVNCEETLSLFRIHASGLGLVKVGNFPFESSARLLTLFPNYEGATFSIVTCGTCPDSVQVYEKTGQWVNGFIATMYEFSLIINGTFEAEEVLSFPQDEPDEDGDWDMWFQPIVDGSSAVTLVYKMTPQKSHLSYATTSITDDGISFITANPKRVSQSQSLLTLFTPLSSQIWIALLLSVVLLFTVLELSSQLREHKHFTDYRFRRTSMGRLTAAATIYQSRLPMADHRRHTLEAIIKPVFGQGTFESKAFRRRMQEEVLYEMLFSIWLLALIVLSNEYTSVMTSHVVLPVYTAPPTTFEQLASSGYTISAVVWTDNIEVNFRALNASYTTKIMDHVNDYNPIDPDCYRTIFEGNTACMGAAKFLDSHGTRFTVNTNGELCYSRSKEIIFPFGYVFAVSLFNPLIFEPLNAVVSAFWESGVGQVWEENYKESSINIGKENAKKQSESLTWLSECTDTKSDNSYFSTFLIRIVLLGNVTAILVHIMDLIRSNLPILTQHMCYLCKRFSKYQNPELVFRK